MKLKETEPPIRADRIRLVLKRLAVGVIEVDDAMLSIEQLIHYCPPTLLH